MLSDVSDTVTADGNGSRERASIRSTSAADRSRRPRRTCAVNPHNLMEVARALADHAPPGEAAPGRQHRVLRDVPLCLAASAADLFIGAERDSAGPTARWSTAGPGARACKGMREFPAEIRDFAEAFVA